MATVLGLIPPQEPQLLEQYLSTLAEGEFAEAVMGFMANLPARPLEGPEVLPGSSGLAGLMQVRPEGSRASCSYLNPT